MGQLWCPIWALAMELLDASEGQPRDQATHAHLLGPPSPQSFLMAPEGAEGEGDSSSSNSSSNNDNNSNLKR